MGQGDRASARETEHQRAKPRAATEYQSKQPNINLKQQNNSILVLTRTTDIFHRKDRYKHTHPSHRKRIPNKCKDHDVEC